MPLPANTAWFTLNLNGQNDFQVYSFTGHEAVSLPYSFTVEVVRAAPVEDLNAFIGVPTLLTIFDRSGRSRLVHGLVREMRRLRRGHHLTHYQCVLVPRLWFLGQNRDHRIFQRKSVPDIIAELLQEQGFAAETFAFKCFHSYQPREYCVQYGESDLHFISRLCEEEGIYYYFEHAENNHCLCFSDMPGGPRIGGESDLRYFPGSGQPADTAVVARIALHSQSVSDQATCRDWSFLTPATLLDASAREPDFDKAPVAPGISYDVYRYPHLHQNQTEGERYAELELLRQLTFQLRLEAESDVSRFTPGFTFSIHGHERDEVNAGWWVTGVEHRGEQPQVLEREAPDRGMRYAAQVEAVPEQTRFVPERVHLKNRIVGDQTALVTGPAGEEIYPDKHGRVKVQFFWDREGNRNENTSCWIRVSQGWAGTGFGTMAIPRIGQEVVVSFLEGDPDRPLITGRMYNAGAMPPYELPAHKTRTVFKSMSTPGGDGPRGFNELTVEDRAGQEEIYVHGEKDGNVHVKNDWKEHILHDKHRTVDRHTYVRTEGETHETLHGVRKSELDANDNLTVHADSHTHVDGKWLRRVGGEVHLYAGNKAVLEAGTEATLQGGGSWIKLDPSGVTMGGPVVSLGGGGSPKGVSAATPAIPQYALLPGQTVFPVYLEKFPQPPESSFPLMPETAEEKVLKVTEITIIGEKIVPCSTIKIMVTKFNKENPSEEEKKSVKWEIEKNLIKDNNTIDSKYMTIVESENGDSSITIKICNLEFGSALYTFTPYIKGIRQEISSTIEIKSMELIRKIILDAAGVIPRENYSKTSDHLSEKDCGYSSIVIHHAGPSFHEYSKPDDTYEKDYQGIPYHYLIDNDGKIYEGRHIKYKGSHVFQGNSKRIGICFLGDFDPDNDFSSPKNAIISIGDYFMRGKDMMPNVLNIASVKLLVRVLIENFNITELGGHREVAQLIHQNLTVCPGKNLMPVVEELRIIFNLSPPQKGYIGEDISQCN